MRGGIYSGDWRIDRSCGFEPVDRVCAGKSHRILRQWRRSRRGSYLSPMASRKNGLATTKRSPH